MDDIKTFKLSWHYTCVIIPLILIVTTAASFSVIKGLFTNQYYNIRYIIVPPFTAYLWYKLLTVPFKIHLIQNRIIKANSIVRRSMHPIEGIVNIKSNYFSYTIRFKEKTLKITNLMENTKQLIALLSSR